MRAHPKRNLEMETMRLPQLGLNPSPARDPN